MVEIINEQPCEHVYKDVICLSCGKTLRYVPNDVTFFELDPESTKPLLVGFQVDCSITCPGCNHRVSVRCPSMVAMDALGLAGKFKHLEFNNAWREHGER